MFTLCVFTDKWSPALQIRTVLLSIQALLSAPNPDDPLANDVAEQWKKEESKAIETGALLDIGMVCDTLVISYVFSPSPPSLPSPSPSLPSSHSPKLE